MYFEICNSGLIAMKSYAVFATDADINYYNDAAEELFCSLCGSYISSKPYFPNDLQVKGLKKDFSFSYDGQLIISTQAKAFLEKNSSTELEFYKVSSNPDAFVMRASCEVIFNSVKRETRFINRCAQCGKFESVVGAMPPFLSNVSEIKSMGVYFTDIQFGSGREKSPLVIVGEEMGEILKQTFREIDLEEVRF